MGQIIDGAAIARTIEGELSDEIARLLKHSGIVPGLATIRIGHDEASAIYVERKHRMARKLGIASFDHLLPSATEDEVMKLISKLNADVTVHAILLQLPLPQGLTPSRLIEQIDPRKDVDCLHPINLGKLVAREAVLPPCTPQAVIELLKRSGVEISGKRAVVIGRSRLVGKLLSAMLLNENATVTVCHSKTINLSEVCRTAEILASAIGKPRFIGEGHIGNKPVVIDVGITRLPSGRIVGDVDFDYVKDKAWKITPVPGGVGPMTIMMLMKNVIRAAGSNK